MELEEYLRSFSDGARRANDVGNFINEARVAIGVVVSDAGDHDEIKYTEGLTRVCQTVRGIVDQLKGKLTELDPTGSVIGNNLKRRIEEIYGKIAGEIGKSVDLRNDPGVDTEFERMLVENPNKWEVISRNLGVIVFNECIHPYILALGDLLPGDEDISRDDYAPIKQLAILLKNAVNSSVALARREFGTDKFSFEDLRKFMLPRFETIARSCESNKMFKVKGFEFGEEPVRMAAIEAANRLVLFLGNIDDVDFILAEPEASFEGFESEDLLFLPNKAKATMAVAEEISLAEELREDMESSVKLADLAASEKALLYRLWVERRDPIRGPQHTLNGKMRKEIAYILNERLHGGLALRHTTDVTVLLEEFGVWELEEIVRKGKDREKMKTFNAALVKVVVNDYLSKVVDVVVTAFKKGQEEANPGFTGPFVAVREHDFAKLLKFLAELKRHCRTMVTLEREDPSPEELRGFYVDGISQIERSLNLCIEVITNESLVGSFPGLAEAVKAGLLNVPLDPSFLLDNLGRHDSDLPPVSEEVDIKEFAATALFGIIYTSVSEDGYSGKILPQEREVLETQCQLYPINQQSSLEEVMTEITQSGLMREWTTLLNEELYGGLEIRKPERVEIFIRELLVEIMIGLEEQGSRLEEEITPELQGRIDSVVEWVESLPGSSTRTYRFILADLRSRLAPDVVKNMPLYITVSVLEKLELCMRRATVDDKYVRQNLSEEDFGILMDAPVLSYQRKWPSLARIGFKLEDLTKQIAVLKEELKEKEGIREEAELLTLKLRESEAATKGYEEEIALKDSLIAETNLAIGSEYNRSGSLMVALDEDKVGRLRVEKDSLNLEKETLMQAKRVVEDSLPGLEQRIREMEIEAGGLEALVTKAKDLRELRKALLAGLDKLYENGTQT